MMPIERTGIPCKIDSIVQGLIRATFERAFFERGYLHLIHLNQNEGSKVVRHMYSDCGHVDK